jgi:Type VI secretion system/phage-baseplate injector OB domain
VVSRQEQDSYLGKYRGRVEDNVDPDRQGRLKVSVPNVLQDEWTGWALPCVPYAGPGVGFFAIPPVGASVWVEFEGGNVESPIWSGCFWAAGERVPADPATPEVKVFKTEGVSLTMKDQSGGLTVEVGPPAVPIPLKLVFDSNGIELRTSAASVKLTPVSVSVNDGALEVT